MLSRSGSPISSHPHWMRRAALALSTVILWTFVLAAPVQALAQQKPKSAEPEQRPLTDTEMQRLGASFWLPAATKAGEATASKTRKSAKSFTLLDEVGKLTVNIPPAYPQLWKKELQKKTISSKLRMTLLLWSGEYDLARNQNPERAQHTFEQIQQMAGPSNPLYGLATYDRFLTLFYQGRYLQSVEAIQKALTVKPRLQGFDRLEATLWLQHARACAGYHQERSNLGDSNDSFIFGPQAYLVDYC